MSVVPSYNFQKFDLKKLTCGTLATFIGKRGSGKSYLMREFFYLNRKNINNVVVFSSTEGENQFYSEFVPKSFIHTTLDIDHLQKIFDCQKKHIVDQRALCRKNGVEYKEKTWKDNLLIIIDDFMHKKNLFNTETMKNITFNGRHSNLTVIIMIQYSMVLSPEYRTQVDVSCIFKETIIANKKRLYEYWAGFFPTYREFERILEKMTANYECMVVKLTNTDAQSAKGGIENMCFWYKASNPPKFKLGNELLWKAHKQIQANIKNKRRIVIEDEEARTNNRMTRVL